MVSLFTTDWYANTLSYIYGEFSGKDNDSLLPAKTSIMITMAVTSAHLVLEK